MWPTRRLAGVQRLPSLEAKARMLGLDYIAVFEGWRPLQHGGLLGKTQRTLRGATPNEVRRMAAITFDK
jgi:hypothetical protein